jgi:NYN domain-containing protein
VTIPNVSIHFGHYLTHQTMMRLAQPPARGSAYVRVLKTEEKGSDVNLASLMLLDAFRSDCEVAVVVSNDSDLCLPIEIARHELAIKVGVVNPHPASRRSRALEADFFRQIRRGALRTSQLPAQLKDAHGIIHKPPSW